MSQTEPRILFAQFYRLQNYLTSNGIFSINGQSQETRSRQILRKVRLETEIEFCEGSFALANSYPLAL